MEDFNKNFYIGYETNKEKSKSISIKYLLIYTCLFFIGISFYSIKLQMKSNDFTYLYLDEVELSGTLIVQPVPILIVKNKDSVAQFILVGKGKNGLKKSLKKFILENKELYQIEVSIKGMPIYGKPYHALEIDDHDEAIQLKVFHGRRLLEEENEPNTILYGELLDSKCYLGVMKPGEGILHRICAINCLRGGLPMLFKENLSDRVYVAYFKHKDDEMNSYSFAGENIYITCKIRLQDEIFFVEISSVEIVKENIFGRNIISCN